MNGEPCGDGLPRASVNVVRHAVAHPSDVSMAWHARETSARPARQVGALLDLGSPLRQELLVGVVDADERALREPLALDRVAEEEGDLKVLVRRARWHLAARCMQMGS